MTDKVNQNYPHHDPTASTVSEGRAEYGPVMKKLARRAKFEKALSSTNKKFARALKKLAE